jgi:hypothetical protein
MAWRWWWSDEFACHWRDRLRTYLARNCLISAGGCHEIRTRHHRVPKATIQAVELEREKGKLMFSYDMKTTGKSGIDEVNVDAMTGKVIGFSHESPATERKEAAAEAKEKVEKKPATKKP